MRRITGLFLTILMALLLMWVVRSIFLTQLTTSNNACPPYFLSGDHLLVNRVAYGVRIPGTTFWRSNYYWADQPDKGDWLAYNNPADKNYDLTNRSILLGRCDAIPGDTIWLDTLNKNVSLSKHYGLFPLVVPGKEKRFAVKQGNIFLYEFLMRRNEGKRTAIKDGKLFIDNRICDSIVFSQDYYWVSAGSNINLPDSRSFGFLPHSHLIGKLWMYSYSIDSSKEFPSNFRKDRFFQVIQ